MNKKSIIISVGIIACAVLLMLGIKTFKDNAVASGNELPVSQYINAPKSFAGNIYNLTVQIDSQLAYDDIAGRMLLVKADAESSLPVYVPNVLPNFNPMVGQKYKFTVKINGVGMLTLTDYKKI